MPQKLAKGNYVYVELKRRKNGNTVSYDYK